MKRTCDKCKLYNKDKEFNCEFYNICIPDIIIASKCKYFINKAPRKRCNKCIYLKYKGVIIRDKRIYAYMCVKRNIAMSYTALKHCNKYKKIE